MENIQVVEKWASGAPPANNHVEEVMRRAERELRQLMEERAAVTKRICNVKRTILGLANMFGDTVLGSDLSDLIGRDSGSRQPGITRACRRVLLEAGRPMSAHDVCDQIQRTMPVLLERHKDPMATVYTILGRLVEYGEVNVLQGDRGQRTWLWASDRADGAVRQDTAHHSPDA